ncbi:hypothetical protein Ssi02_23690 [Sinosporangium siamense]|uniref:Peptidase S8/S53 domain-containing protein n=1 Tax=Sinosporangium siamense TaxID=1367973 RepID=A0A919REH8_9ACTN|nr:hypothetical protein Ssi02_23690 [Sinosporangium siamense]
MITLPFSFPFYQHNHRKVTISTHGYLSFSSGLRDQMPGWNERLPSHSQFHAAIYPFWDDLVVDDRSGIYTANAGTAPARTTVVEWRDVAFKWAPAQRVSPTDLNGRNPRPDLAPHVINNSWGGEDMEPWFAPVVDAWTAAGIFTVFGNGNRGPTCNGTGSPAADTNSYSAGAFGADNTIASFSSRGIGDLHEIKPNIAAPGCRCALIGAGGRLRRQVRHIDGVSACRGHCGTPVVRGARAKGRHRSDPGNPRSLRSRRRRHPLRWHRRQEQHLGRGPPGRPSGGARNADRPRRWPERDRYLGRSSRPPGRPPPHRPDESQARHRPERHLRPSQPQDRHLPDQCS